MHKNECHYHGSMNSTDEVEDKNLYKESVHTVHKLFYFPEKNRTKIKGDYILVSQVPSLVSAPKTILCRKKQFHSVNASENFLTENEKKDNGIFLRWLS